VFRKADKLRPGAFATLERKALKLVGGPDAPTEPAGRTVYGMLIAEGKADLFLTYCTNAMEAKKDVAGAQIVALPDELAVGADYGLTVIANASPDAYRFAMTILSADAQRILAKYGFSAPTLPQ
jgi:molybdate transport system substrate-binding protein